jgi:alpha-galactosidase
MKTPAVWSSLGLAVAALAVSLPAQPTPAAAPDLGSFILTPPPAHNPRLTGAAIYGERPASPFLFTVTATGDRPMTFSATGLPPGLKLDPATGQITGSVAAPGTFTVYVNAKNALGSATRDLKLVIGDQISLTPPMGWNSWNSWAGNVDKDKVMQSVRALVSTGLINHGWSYVNIDDTWQGERTGPDHALLANDKFPDMKGMVDEIHALGLKAGIYSTPWITSYANYAGGSAANAEGTGGRGGGGANHHIGEFHFMAADAKQFAAWGFDYLKYDWDNQKVPDIQEMSDALRASGRDIIYSLSNSLPRGEGPDLDRLANAWRTTGDINDQWGRQSDYHHGMAENGFSQDAWAPYSGPGHWIDPDMLVVGRVSVGLAMHNSRLTPDEQYTHISLWCLLAAPLLIGCDLQRVDAFTLNLLSNDEVLDVDQDVLGKQAVRVGGPAFVPPAAAGRRGRRGGAAGAAPAAGANGAAPAPGAAGAPATPVPAAPPDNPGGNGLVYARPLADGSLAVGLFNVGPREEKVTATWKDLGVNGQRLVRDLWRQKDLGTFTDEFSATVPSHGVVLVKVQAP